MSSMADHLRSQEYSRLRDAAGSLLIEPHMSDEDAERLVEAYERNDTSAADYLAMMSTRPFTPSTSTHSVIIASGTYCSKVVMPMVFKSFRKDHGNPVVEELLSRREVALVEKAPSGGVLVHVRSSEAARKLVGQDVNLLGRKFKIKHQSPLADKFYLDIFGIRSTATANALFMGVAELGARPLFMTPRDVNIQAQVATPTWRFYFGHEQPPACIITRGFVTNQLVYGRNFFIARGKRSLAPPQRAVGFKQSPYAVVLPTGLTQRNPESGDLVNADQYHPRHASKQAGEASEATTALVQEEGRSVTSFSNLEHVEHSTQTAADKHHSGGYGPMSVVCDTEVNETAEIVGAQSDQDMLSATSDDDVDMTRQLESGFKRTKPSFADENPYAVLETMDCEFETFEPRTPSGTTSGVFIMPHLAVADHSREAQEPLPTKRRSTNLDTPHHPVLVPDETVLALRKPDLNLVRIESRKTWLILSKCSRS